MYTFLFVCVHYLCMCVPLYTACAVPSAICFGLLSHPGPPPFGAVLQSHGQKMFILTLQYNPNMLEIIRIKYIYICQPGFISPVCENTFYLINDVIP